MWEGQLQHQATRRQRPNNKHRTAHASTNLRLDSAEYILHMLLLEHDDAQKQQIIQIFCVPLWIDLDKIYCTESEQYKTDKD